jgi:hypothetical protein
MESRNPALETGDGSLCLRAEQAVFGEVRILGRQGNGTPLFVWILVDPGIPFPRAFAPVVTPQIRIFALGQFLIARVPGGVFHREGKLKIEEMLGHLDIPSHVTQSKDTPPRSHSIRL